MAGRTHDVVVIGASAGGIEALKDLLQDLPADLRAMVLVVQHTAAESPGALAGILNRGSRLRVSFAEEGEEPQQSRVYLAPPDRHLLVEPGRLRVVRGPHEHRFRPAIDALFRSAARSFGSRVIGVILSGALDDGTAGLYAVKRMGGLAVVQDPEDAQTQSMPASAIEHVSTDHVVGIREMAQLLPILVGTPAPEVPFLVPRVLELEVDASYGGHDAAHELPSVASGTPLTCPLCHGVLWGMQEGGLHRFRCHIGHAFTAESLQALKHEEMEQAIGSALRALEEQLLLFERLERRLQESGHPSLAAHFRERSKYHSPQVLLLRELLKSLVPPHSGAPSA